ncbi:hypothetical protein AGLY_007840, partial [Aphis glycines]
YPPNLNVYENTINTSALKKYIYHARHKTLPTNPTGIVFCLLPDKKTRNILFQNAIRSKCNKYNLILNQKNIEIDFETVIHNVIKLVWPNCIIKGCGFHLIFVIVAYEQNNWLKYSFRLIYLNPGDVSVYFVIDIMSDIPKSYLYSQYTDCLLETYIIYKFKIYSKNMGMHNKKLISNY